MRKIITLILLVILFTSLEQNSNADQSFLADYNQTVYNEESVDIPIGNANDILQTKDGYLWFSTYNGLINYNGKNCHYINRETMSSFTSSSINATCEDSKGTLWVGTNDKGIMVFKNNEFTHYYLDEDAESCMVKCIETDGSNKVFIATNVGLYIVQTGKEDIITKILDDTIIDYLYTGNDKSLWIIDGDAKIYKYEIKSDKTYELKNTTYTGSCIVQDSNNALWIGNQNNFIKKVDYSTNLEQNIFMTNREGCNSLFIDSTGKIWTSTENGVGYFYNNIYHEVDGALINSSIEEIYEDYEGTLWVISSKTGILKLVRSKFTDLSFKLDLPDKTINGIINYNGNYYIGTDDCLIILNSSFNRIENDLTSHLDGKRIRDMHIDSDNNLWFAIYKGDYGLLKYTENTTTYSGDSLIYGQTTNGVFSAEYSSIKQVRVITGNANKMVVGTNSDGVYVIESGAIKSHYTKDNGLLLDRILCLEINSDGTIYAGTDGGGVSEINSDGTIKNYTTTEGLNSNIILRITKYNDGVIISTGDYKLSYLKNGAITSIESITSVGSIYDILIYNDYIWLLTSNGMYSLEMSKFFSNKVETLKKYGSSEGLTTAVNANSWNYLSSNGDLYICTSKKVYSINLKNHHENIVSPKVAISSVSVDSKEYINVSELKVSSSTRRISFEISILSSLNSSSTMVTYQLRGYDDKPTTVSYESLEAISYTNLNGGNYTFEASVINSDGVKSELSAKVSIVKEYSFFERPLARVLIVLLGAVILYFAITWYIKFRTKKLKQRHDESKKLTEDALETFVEAIDARDKYTNGHSLRVAKISSMLATKMGFNKDYIQQIYYAALLHDVGKLGIPDKILQKNGKLTEDEYEVMKTHPRIGAEILKNIQNMPMVVDAALYHHERFDGEGYLNKLKGLDIPLISRIVCVADAYDAMSTDRVYREARTTEYILNEFEINKGKQFDAEIAEIMIEIIHEELQQKVEEEAEK